MRAGVKDLFLTVSCCSSDLDKGVHTSSRNSSCDEQANEMIKPKRARLICSRIRIWKQARAGRGMKGAVVFERNAGRLYNFPKIFPFRKKGKDIVEKLTVFSVNSFVQLHK